MYKHSLLGCFALLFPALASGAPSLLNNLDKRQDCVFDSATNPTCWDGTHDLQTNSYEEAPHTGVVREYWFDITNTTMAPDGVERMVLAVNGSVPGPTIIADWGDTVGEYLTAGSYQRRTDRCASRPRKELHAEQRHESSLPWHSSKLHQRGRWRRFYHPMPDCSGRLHHLHLPRFPVRFFVVPQPFRPPGMVSL